MVDGNEYAARLECYIDAEDVIVDGDEANAYIIDLECYSKNSYIQKNNKIKISKKKKLQLPFFFLIF